MSAAGDLLAVLGTGTYTVTREAAGSYGAADGEWDPGASTSFTLVGSLQPASGRDRKNLPEGMATGDVRVLYSETEVRTASDRTKIPADAVTVDGEVYEVVHVEPWGGTLIPHYKALLVRRGYGA